MSIHNPTNQQELDARRARNRASYYRHREARISKTKEYYEKNKPEILVKLKKYSNKNKAKIKARKAAYYIEHRDYVLNDPKKKKARSDWASKNKEKKNAHSKNWRTRNIDYVRERDRRNNKLRWPLLKEIQRLKRQANPERFNSLRRTRYKRTAAMVLHRQAERNSKKKNLVHPNSSKSSIKSIYRASSALSLSTKIKHAVDHIIPSAHKGWHHEENLQVMPASLNSSKRDNPFWLAPSMSYKDWREVPRELWPIDLRPKYLALVEQNKGVSIRWDAAAA